MNLARSLCAQSLGCGHQRLHCIVNNCTRFEILTVHAKKVLVSSSYTFAPEYVHLPQKHKGSVGATGGNAYDDPQDALSPVVSTPTAPDGTSQLEVVPPPLLPKTSPGKLKASLDVLRQEDKSFASEGDGGDSNGGDAARSHAAGASDTYMTLHAPTAMGSDTSDGAGTGCMCAQRLRSAAGELAFVGSDRCVA